MSGFRSECAGVPREARDVSFDAHDDRGRLAKMEAGCAPRSEPAPAAAEQLDACTAAIVAAPWRHALFLDIDGTLLDLAETPDAVSVPGRLVETLRRLEIALGGAVAVVTGRSISDADRLLDPLRLTSSGVHGTEFRFERSAKVTVLAPQLDAGLLCAIRGLAARIPGIFVEAKGPGCAVHYRRAPSVKPLLEQLLTRLIAHRCEPLTLSHGRQVMEIIPAGFSKGTALRLLLSRRRFAGRRPVMIGDDVGDEAAFVAAERQHGFALRVASDVNRPCDSHFQSPAAVRVWLAGLLTKLEGAR